MPVQVQQQSGLTARAHVVLGAVCDVMVLCSDHFYWGSALQFWL